MSEVFRTMSPAARAAQLAAYARHLLARNGAPDLEGERLPRRDRWMEQLFAEAEEEGAPALREEVRAAFSRLMEPGAQPRAGDPPEALWMAIAAQFNVGEEYGVRAILAVARHSPGPDGAADPELHIELEELYHTRMLIDAVRLLGADAALPAPHPFLRGFLQVVAHMPGAVKRLFVLAAECNGVALFLRLRERAAELFGTSGAGARVRRLLDEIILDELGHVAYLRASLGPVRMALASFASRLLVRQLYRSIPSTPALFDLDTLVADVHALAWDKVPPELRARAFNPWGEDGGDGIHAAPQGV